MFVACMLLKYDSNLADVRDLLVPSMVTEDEFWRNYFYSIELIKRDMGLPCRIGTEVAKSEREKLALVQESKLNESKLQVEAREKGVTFEQAEMLANDPKAKNNKAKNDTQRRC